MTNKLINIAEYITTVCGIIGALMVAQESIPVYYSLAIWTFGYTFGMYSTFNKKSWKHFTLFSFFVINCSVGFVMQYPGFN